MCWEIRENSYWAQLSVGGAEPVEREGDGTAGSRLPLSISLPVHGSLPCSVSLF